MTKVILEAWASQGTEFPNETAEVVYSPTRGNIVLQFKDWRGDCAVIDVSRSDWKKIKKAVKKAFEGAA
jgi:hypothetical protein